MTLKEIAKVFTQELSMLYSASEVQVLWNIFGAHHLGYNSIELKINSKQTLFKHQIDSILNSITLLKTGKPYQQILGKTLFFGLSFEVNDQVLIPRPETEELLELAINKIRNNFTKNEKIRILDIGTGSGVIPIILKREFPEAIIESIDISESAQQVARKNAQIHHTNIQFTLENYLELELKRAYDIIISNPPYIDQLEIDEIDERVKNFEPSLALFSPSPDPLIFYKKIATDAQKFLSKNGWIFLEINQKLGAETLSLFSCFSSAKLLKDISGNERFIIARI